VLLIDRNFDLPTEHRYRVLSPSRCLSGITRRANTAGVNLAGLFRASERDAGLERGARSDALPDEPSQALPPAGPMAD